jgi:hypothetical protein
LSGWQKPGVRQNNGLLEERTTINLVLFDPEPAVESLCQ